MIDSLRNVFELLGCTREEVLAKPAREFLLPEAPGGWCERTHRWGVEHDVTENKRMERALRRSLKKSSKAFLARPYAIVIFTIEDGKLIEVNSSSLRIARSFSRQTFPNPRAYLRLCRRRRFRGQKQAGQTKETEVLPAPPEVQVIRLLPQRKSSGKRFGSRGQHLDHEKLQSLHGRKSKLVHSGSGSLTPFETNRRSLTPLIRREASVSALPACVATISRTLPRCPTPSISHSGER